MINIDNKTMISWSVIMDVLRKIERIFYRLADAYFEDYLKQKSSIFYPFNIFFCAAEIDYPKGQLFFPSTHVADKGYNYLYQISKDYPKDLIQYIESQLNQVGCDILFDYDSGNIFLNLEKNQHILKQMPDNIIDNLIESFHKGISRGNIN